jgi:hypothetical protein
MKWLFATLLFMNPLLASNALADDDAIKITCSGGTNYGDDVHLELNLSGECEGNYGGQSIFCNVEVKLLDEVNGSSAGEMANIFVNAPENWIVFSNKVMMQFTWQDKVINILDWSTPLQTYKDFGFRMNFGGGRTWADGTCNRTR